DAPRIVSDRNGGIWVSAQAGNVVGKLTLSTGRIQLVRLPTENARPYGIKMDSKGRPWVMLFGTNKIGTVAPATMQLREITLPRPETRPRRMEITSDDKIWYGDYDGGKLGRYDPATGKIDEWQLPGGADARPYAVVRDDQDRSWVAETAQPNKSVAVDAKPLQFSEETAVPTAGGPMHRAVYGPALR